MYVPQYAGPFEGYSQKFLVKNYWKVARIMAWEDAQQECVLIFLRIKARYEVEEGAHFMALFKTSLHQHFIDLAKKATAVKTEVTQGVSDDGDDVMLPAEPAGDLDTDAGLLDAIRHAPPRVRATLTLMLNGPSAVVETVVADLNKGRVCRARAITKINHLLGFPEGTDAVEEVYTYFSHV